MHEDQIIARAAAFGRHHPQVILGIGDDAALISPSEKTLVWTVDTLVEHTHFLRDMPAREIGWKSLAVNLSDLAAMNALPLAALLSLSLPVDLSSDWREEFFCGLQQACEAYGVDLAGGDTVRSREIQISLSLLGESTSPVTRYGAQAGDILVVTGSLGGSAAGLYSWQHHLDQPALLARHWHPQPRFAEALTLTEAAPRLAMLDTSDGLARSLQLLCNANQLGCEVNGLAIPIEEGLPQIANPAQIQDWALNGGEDYELLAALPAEAATHLQSDPRFTVIGQLKADPAQLIFYPHQTLDLQNGEWGFQHFQSNG